ncbi:MAG: hypothetical protein IT385_21700 [Deltaproteobacteria bacterium]|nr:hypothetical protein [Deltaproteobacteria bacterium]
MSEAPTSRPWGLLIVSILPWPILFYTCFSVPERRLEAAPKELRACIAEAHEEMPDAAPSRLCDALRDRLPTHLPWTAERADEVALRIDRMRALTDLDNPLYGDGARAARAEAAERVLTLDERLPPEVFGASGFDELADAGASEELLAAADRARTLADHARALDAALALGDVERARALARATEHEAYRPGTTPRSFEKNDDRAERERGATLCLLGLESAGRAALERADDRTTERSPDEAARLEHEVALLACGGPPRLRSIVAPDHVMATRVALLALGAPRDDRGADVDEILNERHLHADLEDTLALLGLRHEARPLGAAELLAATLDIHGGSLLGGVVFDPWRVVGAARAARELAATPIGPIVVRDRSEQRVVIDDAASALRDQAATAEIVAALRFASLGRDADALSAIERRLASEPTVGGDAPLIATVLTRIGHAERALEVARRARAEHPEDRALSAALDTQEARALAALGRYAEALPLALRAHEAAIAARREAAASDSPRAAERPFEESSWLVLALALRSGGDAPTLALAEEPRAWFDAARTPIASRPERWALEGPWLFTDGDALGPMLYLIGASAPGDVERWLDHRASLHRAGPLAMMQAGRAEAARWRGDEATARTWRDRRARVLGLVTDYRSALLAGVAGIL